MKWNLFVVPIVIVILLGIIGYQSIALQKVQGNTAITATTTNSNLDIAPVFAGRQEQTQTVQQPVQPKVQAAPQPSVQAQYSSCVSDAETNYNQAWAGACASQYTRENQEYAICYSQYGDLKNYCNQLYPGRFDGSARCSLDQGSAGTATSLNAELTSDKDRCATLYKN
jgi:hypothetical protein